MNYSDITIAQYSEIQSGKSALEVLFKKSLNDIKISELKAIEFLKTPYKAKLPKNKYKIANRDYEVNLNVNKLSVSQYLDLQTFLQDAEKYCSNILAVFLLPKGEQYGDTDPIENAKFLNENCSVDILFDINFFFFKVLMSYMKATQESLEKLLKRQIRQTKDKSIKMTLLKNLLQIRLYGLNE